MPSARRQISSPLVVRWRCVGTRLARARLRHTRPPGSARSACGVWPGSAGRSTRQPVRLPRSTGARPVALGAWQRRAGLPRWGRSGLADLDAARRSGAGAAAPRDQPVRSRSAPTPTPSARNTAVPGTRCVVRSAQRISGCRRSADRLATCSGRVCRRSRRASRGCRAWSVHGVARRIVRTGSVARSSARSSWPGRSSWPASIVTLIRPHDVAARERQAHPGIPGTVYHIGDARVCSLAHFET